ncbi:MAG: LuxR C-terminal-related transcriptional regulator [Acidiferrobacterales bacterium]|nr:LuxR C-terminal-related transcriptional regulator [Acidiferrobacterales bacterium]
MLLERESAIAKFSQSTKNLSRSGGVVLVAGEAGIGKTSLLEQVRAIHNKDFEFCWSGCEPLFTPRPFGPLYDFAIQHNESLLKSLDRQEPAHTIFASLYKSLEALHTPLIWVIEDLHWADQATIDLLKYVARRICFVKCLLVISYRDDDIETQSALSTLLGLLPSAHTIRLALPPLTKNAIMQLAQNTPHNPEHLYQITAGNPFFVTELIASESHDHDQGNIPNVPASVRDAINARLVNLVRPERDFLEFLSLIPNSIPLSILRHIAGQESETLAMACVARNLLHLDTKGRIRFRHELARLGTLATVPINQQHTVHMRILKALEAREDIDLAWVLHHAEGALDAERVLKYAPVAARAAADLGAHKEAADYLSKALKFVEEAETEQAAQLYEDWAYEVGLATQIDDKVIKARQHAITLWRALGRKDKVGENLRWLSRLHWYCGRSAEADRFANEAIKLFESIPASSELAMAYSMRAQLDMLNDRLVEAVCWGNKALELEQQHPCLQVRVHALNNVGTALLFDGDESGEPLLTQSLELANQYALHEDAARVYTNYSDYCLRYKKLAQAETLTSEGIAYDTAHDLDSWTYYLVGLQAYLRLEQGRLIDAETISAGVQGLPNQTLLMKLPALTVLAKASMRLGRNNAQALLQTATDNAQATDEMQYIIPCRLAQLEYAWLTGNRDSALAELAWLCELQHSLLDPWRYGEIMTWIKRFDLYSKSEESTHSAKNLNCQLDTCSFANHSIALKAITEEIQTEHAIAKPYRLELQGRISEATDAWLKLGMPYNAALSLIHSIDSSIESNIEGQLQQANQLLSQIGAQAAIQALYSRAQEHDLLDSLPKRSRGPYKQARKHPAGLTAKEQQVLAQIVTGASNHDIAETLSRSKRTIENHVSSILKKLNVNSRIEAILRVQNEPWLSS